MAMAVESDAAVLREKDHIIYIRQNACITKDLDLAQFITSFRVGALENVVEERTFFIVLLGSGSPDDRIPGKLFP